MKDTYFEADARYICNEGYTLIGLESRKCSSNGQWSSQAPYCRINECPQTSEIISNGHANSTQTTYGSVISYKCDEGYQLSNKAVRKCEANGNWDVPIPTCQVVKCPSLTVSMGSLSSFNRNYGAVVKIECLSNYQLIGSKERKCQADGSWSGETSRCEKVLCQLPDSIPNSKLSIVNETTIQISCYKDFGLRGSNFRFCDKSGNWYPEAPKCVPLNCEDRSQMKVLHGNIQYEGNLIGSKISTSCLVGYTLTGDEMIECLPNGQWQDLNPPRCVPVVCPFPGLIDNGDILPAQYQYDYKTEIELFCNDGFKENGSPFAICQENGTWNNYPLECVGVTCSSEDVNLKNGELFSTGNGYEDTVTYLCFEGFKLEGENIKVCQQNGKWSAPTPVCREIFCFPPDHDGEDQLSFSPLREKYEYDGVINYKCLEGYELIGPSERFCEEGGLWSGESPQCYPLSCQEPPPFQMEILN